MLTADLVRVRQTQGKLSVVALKGKSRERAIELAALYLRLAEEQAGNTHEHLKQAWSSVEISPREKKLALGLQKLIEDRCEFEAQSPVDPRALRSEVFLLAARLRREQGREFDRRQPFSELSQQYGAEPESLDAALYSDLRSQHRLLAAPSFSAESLVEQFEHAQYQAVLLRAVRVIAHVRCKDPAQYRQLFRALKFRRLLYTMVREAEGYRIEIDGPFSLFESVTKYGLQLALVFPVLCACDELRLSAELRWGKLRKPLSFHYDHVLAPTMADAEVALPDDVADLRRGLEKLDSDWRVLLNEDILDLPGIGLCVPDLKLLRGADTAYVEVLGFWSRDAVWKRVELVGQGLSQRIVFAVSSRLRVSEEVLEDDTSALYVYKGVMSPKALLQKVEALCDKGAGGC